MHTSFPSLSAFLHMGHNGDYVWTAYAIVFFVLGLFLWKSNKKIKNKK